MDALTPAAPPYLSAPAALATLGTFRTTLESCRSVLEAILHSANLLEIVEEFFPEAAARGVPMQPSEAGQYHDLEFFVSKLVNDNLFPLDECFLDVYFEEDSETAMRTIPIVRLFDPEYDLGDDFDGLITAYQLAAALYYADEYGVETYYAVGFDDDDLERLQPLPAGAVSRERLKRLCRKESSPLRHLYRVVRVITGNTRNVFYDGECTCGQCRTIPWSARSVRWLARRYKAADAMGDRIVELSKWLDAHPSHLEEAVRLWNRAAGQQENENDRHDRD